MGFRARRHRKMTVLDREFTNPGPDPIRRLMAEG
jgi:hypothetical protein